MLSTSTRLKQSISKIIDIWKERVLKDVEAARLQGDLALKNSLSSFLEQLAEELSENHTRSNIQIEEGKERSTRIGKQHGKIRAGSLKYTLDQLIFEYHILRQTVCSVLEEDGLLSTTEREIIVAYIEQAVNDAATEFSKTLKDLQERVLHTLAHDLRNPISTAKVSAELILRHPNDSQNCTDKANRIINNLNRLDLMIRELLDSARLKAGEKSGPDFEEVDLDQLVRDIAVELNLIHPGIFIVHSSGKLMGNWNASGLRRIIENLASNAVKHGFEDSPIIIELKDDGNVIAFSVHNEGTPITANDKKLLFQQFHRSAGSKNIGWGIGLSVVQDMVDEHGGSITVDSEEGHGTTFTVKLPKDHRPHIN